MLSVGQGQIRLLRALRSRHAPGARHAVVKSEVVRVCERLVSACGSCVVAFVLLATAAAPSAALDRAEASVRGGPKAPGGESHAVSSVHSSELMLFVDADDDDDDGVADAQQAFPRGTDIHWLEPSGRGHRVRSLRGRAVRVLTEGGPARAKELAALGRVERLGLQGIAPGRAELVLDERTLQLRVYELQAIDAAGRRVDLASSHASVSRTLPQSLRPGDAREPDALRWRVIGPAPGLPDALSFISLSPDGSPVDALEAVALEAVPCPGQVQPYLHCRQTPLIRATMDWLDRAHPRAVEPSLRAQVGGRIAVFGAGLEAGSIRVGGPRETRVGPLQRYKGKLRVRVLRTGPGAGVSIGSDAAGGLEIARREVESANALWGQCGIQFGPASELDVEVVDPPPPHMFAIGCGLGLPASGGNLAFAAGSERVLLGVRAGATAERVAHELGAELRRRGFQVALSPNPRESFAAQPSMDVLVRGPRGEYVALDLPRVAKNPERSLEVCLGAVNLSDGLRHFSDADAAAGTLEERTLLKALVDADPATIDVLVVPYFMTMGRIGESFVDARGLGVRNAIIVDRAAVRAGARSFALAHELGHVLLQVAGHPDDFGVDRPTQLMDADAADSTVFGPRRLSVADCERAILQSGPGAPLPLLEAWPLYRAANESRSDTAAE